MNKSLSDVTFRLQSSLFPAHKLVLCCQSPVFKRLVSQPHSLVCWPVLSVHFFPQLFSMLEGGVWQESHGQEVAVENVSAEAFKEVLKWLYTGDAGFGMSDVQLELALDVLSASDRFMISGLHAHMQNVLSARLSPETCFALYSAGCAYNAPLLQRAAAVYLVAQYQAIEHADPGRAILFHVIQNLFLKENC